MSDPNKTVPIGGHELPTLKIENGDVPTVRSHPHAGDTPSTIIHALAQIPATLINPNFTLQTASPSSTSGPSVNALLTKSHGTRYAIDKEIARGGMGAILRAADADIRREVAIKVMLRGSDESSRRRFVEEAQITGQLEHPNIVPVHEIALDSSNQIYFTMKLVQGRSLRQILTEVKLDVKNQSEWTMPRLLRVLIDVCNAMAFAHSKGVIHRDLKPENIMLGQFGEVLVMDWGLAKIVGVPVQDNVTPSIRSVRSEARESLDGTMEGDVMGTPSFMSPEQADGRISELDARTDIYALGVMLYEILAQTLPIDTTGGPKAMLDRIIKEKIVPPEILAPRRAPLIAKELSAIAMKALAKNKNDRYASALQMRDDIERFLEGHSVSAKRDSAWELAVKLVKRNKGIFATAAAAWFVITALAVWFVISVNHAKKLAEEERNRAKENEALAIASEKRAEAALADFRSTAPTFVAQAQSLIDTQQFAGALDKLDVAIRLVPNSAEYHYLRGNVLESLSLLEMAKGAYDDALRLKPDHVFATQDRDLCAELLRTDHGPTLNKSSLSKLNALMLKQGRISESIATSRLLNENGDLLKKTWKAAFVKAGIEIDDIHLRYGDDGLFQVDLLNRHSVTNLAFMQGMPVSVLNLDGTLVSDLSPLSGSPLRILDLRNTPVQDLSPLRALKLTDLNLGGTNVSDLSPLQGIPLEKLAVRDMRGKITTIAPLKGMPLRDLTLWALPLTDISVLRGMPLQALSIRSSIQIRDWSAIQSLPIKDLDLSNTTFSDLSLLRGMQLKSLRLTACHIADISALRGMPLELIALEYTLVIDLRPLSGMKLRHIDVHSLSITDLSPLRDMPIDEAYLGGNNGITDFSVIATWPLKTRFRARQSSFDRLDLIVGKGISEIDLRNTPVASIAALKDDKITGLHLFGTKVTDLHPVANMPLLNRLGIPADATDIEFLRKLPNLQYLDNRDTSNPRPAAEFWKEYDAKKAGGGK